ncbi:hypothetical protein BDF19DRAFT_449776 [Syncephalis fuscata]|nr:hypothetical protein BDF19DRAFT_449776 [Syncephalis fuscata]
MRPQGIHCVFVPSNATLRYLRQAIGSSRQICSRRTISSLIVTDQPIAVSNNNLTTNFQNKPINGNLKIDRCKVKAVNMARPRKQYVSVEANYSNNRCMYDYILCRDWSKRAVTYKKLSCKQPVAATCSGQPPLVLAKLASVIETDYEIANSSLQLLAKFYTLIARSEEPKRIFDTYRLLRPNQLQAQLRRRDFRYLFRLFSTSADISVANTLSILEDMHLCGLPPNISDYQLVMWKACYSKDWSTVCNLWARIYAIGLCPDALGFTVMLRMATRTSDWLDIEDYLQSNKLTQYDLTPITNYERKRRKARKYIPEYTYDPSQTTWLQATEHILGRMRKTGIDWPPEAWAALVVGHAACGSLTSLCHVLNQMNKRLVPCLPYAADAVIRRIISIDLVLADRISSQLPNLPARTYGRLMEEFSAIGDKPRFYSVLRRAIHYKYIPRPEYIIPLLQRLKDRLQYMNTAKLKHQQKNVY